MKLTNEYMNKLNNAMEEKKNIIAEAGMRIPAEKLDGVAGGCGVFEFPIIEEDITDLIITPTK